MTLNNLFFILRRSTFSSSLRVTLTPMCKHFNTTSCLSLFYESDEKGGYRKESVKVSTREMIREGLKELKHEIALWKNEVKEHFEDDPYLMYRAGETDVLWDFKNPESVNKWITTSDKDHLEGYSTCSFNLTDTLKGHFLGELCTRIPEDGRTKRAGYCNIRTTRARKSFKRETYLDWSMYNMLVLRVRGDGRSYILNIGTKGYFDVMWNDIFHYVLYTRGGPYWQVSKIPFSKFFLGSKGRVQDKQCAVPLSRVTSFGISVGDKINGPFSLEIDYIGLEFNPNHREQFAYEMYKTDKYIAGV